MKTLLSEVTETDPCISVLWVVPPPGGKPLNQTKQRGLLQNYRGESVHPSRQGIPGLDCPRRMELCQEVIFNIIQK